jgi:hypothetical protein
MPLLARANQRVGLKLLQRRKASIAGGRLVTAAENPDT